jgi:hypothetical protein
MMQDSRAIGRATEEPPSVLLGRDEMNIAEFPITLLTDRAPKGLSRIEHKDRFFDPALGKQIIRKLTISTPEEYGLPTSIDDDVILALIHLTKQQNNFTRQEVFFTRRQLIDLLGWTDKGRNYERIETSLDRWASTYLKYENAWWDNEGRRWTSGGFHIIDSFRIRDGRTSSGQGQLFRSQIVWGKEFFQSCQAGYLKSLDYDMYIQLKYHPSKRMYRFLDKRFYHKADWSFELRDFAIEHVGLSRAYRDAGKIKEKLQPGIEELERVGFLELLPREERYRKDGRNWIVRLVRKRSESERPTETGKDSPHPLKAELVARGVTESTAAELLREHPAASIAEKLEVFDWLSGRNDRRIQRNPAGYLVESIRQYYSAPRGFESAAERARRFQVEEQRQRAKIEAKQKAEAEERAREQAELERLNGFWEGLSPAEQARVQAEALASANRFFRAQYLRHRGKNPEQEQRYLKLILDAHLAAMLDGQSV